MKETKLLQLIQDGKIILSSKKDVAALAYFCVDSYPKISLSELTDLFQGWVDLSSFEVYFNERKNLTRTPVEMKLESSYRTLKIIEKAVHEENRIQRAITRLYAGCKSRYEVKPDKKDKKDKKNKKKKKKGAGSKVEAPSSRPKVAYIVNGMVVLGKDQADILGAYSDR